MRVKQLWNYVPLPANIRLVWDRLTFSRLTTIYFAVALIHCFVQVIFQISALYTNTQAASVIAHIAAADPNTKSGFAVLTKGGPLRSCTGMPGSTGNTPCRMVWAGKVAPDAFGGYPDYSYANMTMLTTVSSPTLASTSSVIPSTAPSSRPLSTATFTRTAPTSTSNEVVPSPATNVVVQSPSTTSRSTSSSIAAPTIITSIVSVTAVLPPPTPSAPAPVDPLAPGGSPVTRVGPAKRMYIPSHFPGSSRPHMLSRRDLSLTPVFSQFNGTFMGVQLNGLKLDNHAGSGNHESDEAFISSVCVEVLQWPLQKLWNTQREDAVFIGFQFWVLGMSIVALLNESVPHIIAAFVTHILVTAWSVFQIVHTANFRFEFNRVTTHGACGGVNLLPTYWRARANAEIPVLVLNVVVLLLSAYMSWRLLKTFGWLTFKRVGASLEINRIYKLVLSLGIVIQLSLFFLIVSIALWLEELYHGPSAGESSLATLYKTIVIIQLIALGPWLVMGWYAVRREMRKTMIAFLTLSALFIVAWAGMFVCTVWRLTFLTWMFFRLISVIAATLTALAFGLGIVCWFNFGKDFPKHLKLEEEAEENDFIPAQPTYDPEKGEKVDFPTQNAIPTFADAFVSRPSSIASSSEHSHLNVAPPRVVARPPTYHDFEVERLGHDRSGSMASTSSGSTISVRDPFEQDLERIMSNHSHAAPSVRSTTSSQTAPSVKVGMGKRWVIE